MVKTYILSSPSTQVSPLIPGLPQAIPLYARFGQEQEEEAKETEVKEKEEVKETKKMKDSQSKQEEADVKTSKEGESEKSDTESPSSTPVDAQVAPELIGQHLISRGSRGSTGLRGSRGSTDSRDARHARRGVWLLRGKLHSALSLAPSLLGKAPQHVTQCCFWTAEGHRGRERDRKKRNGKEERTTEKESAARKQESEKERERERESERERERDRGGEREREKEREMPSSSVARPLISWRRVGQAAGRGKGFQQASAHLPIAAFGDDMRLEVLSLVQDGGAWAAQIQMENGEVGAGGDFHLESPLQSGWTGGDVKHARHPF